VPTTVAILDTGIDPARIDPARLVPGIDLTMGGGPSDSVDPHGHGTAMAATVIANSGARVMPVRIICERGYLREDSLIETAFEWIVGRGDIDVVCAAFADHGHSTTDASHRDSVLRRHVLALSDAGVPVVAPAGNGYALNRLSHPQGMAWPAILREVVSVGALGPDGVSLSHHTQRVHESIGTGCRTTIFAPSGPPGGTSGAAAVVAGRLAELRALDPGASVAELVERLLEDCVRAGDDSGLRWPALPVRVSPAGTSP
jgi:hypothetical protein